MADSDDEPKIVVIDTDEEDEEDAAPTSTSSTPASTPAASSSSSSSSSSPSSSSSSTSSETAAPAAVVDTDPNLPINDDDTGADTHISAGDADKDQSDNDDDGEPALIQDGGDDNSNSNNNNNNVNNVDDDDEPHYDIEAAKRHKHRGNTLYLAAKYHEAIEAYTAAVDACPDENPDELGIFHCNRAACYMKLDDADQVIHDTSDALAFKPNYVKALVRRAWAFERREMPNEAIADLKAALALDDKQQPAVAASLARLEKVVAAKQEEQKQEMIDKLKELGNGLLGKFGMSLDNFKAVKDPVTGSYSVNFDQNPQASSAASGADASAAAASGSGGDA